VKNNFEKMSIIGPRLNLNSHTLVNWQKTTDEEISRSKKVLMKYFETLTSVTEKDFDIYKVSVDRKSENFVIYIISPLKKLYILLLDKQTRVLFASHIVKNKFVSKKQRDMRVSLPLKFSNGYQLFYGENLFAVINENGEKTDLQWLLDIPREESSESVDIRKKWNTVQITEFERVDKDNTTYLDESHFIVFDPPIQLAGREWQRVINFVCASYGYWDVNYYLVDCDSKQCIDLNAHSHYHGMGDYYDAVWIEENQLLGYRHSGKETIQENEQLFPPQTDHATNMVKENILRNFPMSTGFEGINTFSFDLDREFSTDKFLQECGE